MRITTVFLAVVLMSSGSSLFGATPTEQMEMVRQDAAMHFQLEITEIGLPKQTPGICRITGEVGQIFEDRLGLLEVGEPVQFGLACVHPVTKLPRSPRRWTFFPDLQAASFVEAYMDLRADSHHPRIATLNYVLSQRSIEKPSTRPGAKETHFVVKVDEASFEEGSQQVDIEGTIQKIFKDDSSLLSVDKKLSFPLDCDTRRTLPCRVVKEAKGQYAEVMFFLNSPLDQAGIIDGLTEEPTCPRDAEGLWCEKDEPEPSEGTDQ